MNKKRYLIIIAIVIFIFLALFTFANPLNNEEGQPNDNRVLEEIEEDLIEKEEQPEEKEEQEEQEEQTVITPIYPIYNNHGVVQRPQTEVDNSYEVALKAVEKLEITLNNEDLEETTKLVEKVKDEEKKEKLEERLEIIFEIFSLTDDIETLVNKVNNAASKIDMNSARSFVVSKDIVNRLSTISNKVIKDLLLYKLESIAEKVEDTNNPKVNIEDGAILNSDTKITVTDESKVTIKLNDKEIGNNYEVSDGVYELVVIDESFNEVKIKFTVDTTETVITLNGDSKIIIKEILDAYTELGAVVTNNLGLNETIDNPEIKYYIDYADKENYEVVTSVDNTKIGTYELVYSYTNTLNNEISVVRVVEVVEVERTINNVTSLISEELGKENIRQVQMETISRIPSNAVKTWDVSVDGDGSVMAWATQDTSGKYTVYVSKNVFGKADYDRENIEKVMFMNTASVPENAIDSWSLSNVGDDSVKVWVLDENNNNSYELYVGQEGGVVAPEDLSYFLFNYKNATIIDVTNLNTSNSTDMSFMFSTPSGNHQSAILEIKGLENFDTSNVTNMHYMFKGLKKVTTLDVSNFDTSKVTDMSGMFYLNQSLTSLDVSNFDTSNVTNMSDMFYSLESMTSLDVSNFDTSKVTNMSGMFKYNYKLQTLDISNFDTSKVTNMEGMFWDCKKLTTLNLGTFDTSSVTNIRWMFQGARNVSTELTIRNKNITNHYASFAYAAEYAGTQIILNYTAETETLVDEILADDRIKNTIKGSLVD